ncbi:hypothetical protein MPTK1_5g04240 [Marchantia polymorpha subsp. ruderalis]|uniref:DUF3504 domain-containing protein n=4 Tax=Marchantia polymorpha TaxID=3197 RepID=A0AAF6BEU3_MARPO|nr:hypothetical protein MARPO_0141s0031 [Marchantia polymorpha]BBN10527.1 hypothetical protein Mp_5g04240 [Marchantia polymorpha subsp. ruderalis]|eukprot:PTQ29457.1 hypothetical protein MARPO_0141s0031 [Marchantia polymorpha]
MATGIMEHLPRDSFRQDSHAMFRIADGDGSFVKNSVDDDVGGIWDWLQSMAGECDQNMSDVTEEDIANALGGGEGGIMDQKPSFAALDREILSTLVASGGNQSTKNDTWSRRRFDEWRLQNGMPTSKAIETMDIETLASQLPTFFQQVMKHNGDHYPLESLLGFYRGFTRIMRKAQEARICETRVIETPFDMRANTLFQRTGVAMLEAMRRSVLAGANKRRKKPSVVSWVSEQALLTDKDHQASHPYGCFRRWTYYCISRFQIRGGKELYNVMDCDFHETRDKDGDHIVYGERLSKNLDSSAAPPASAATLKSSTRGTGKRLKVEPVRVPVKCYQEDVIHTFRQFMKHQPVKVGDEVGKPRHLFLQPIGNPVTNAWFAKSHVSERVLISLFKTMAVVAGVNVKDTSNRPGRPILPSPILLEASPAATMRGAVTSAYGLYGRYDSNVDLQTNGEQSETIKSCYSSCGKRNYEETSGDTRKQEEINQQSSGTSSARSEHDPACNPPNGEATNKAALETLVDSERQHSNEVSNAITDLGHSPVNKLQIARSQLKELEVTLFNKMGFNDAGGITTSPKDQSLRETMDVAVAQLKALEATLMSMDTNS